MASHGRDGGDGVIYVVLAREMDGISNLVWNMIWVGEFFSL